MLGKKINYDVNKTIFEYFDENILKNESFMNKTAIVYKTKSLTFSQVQRLIAKINKFIYSSLSSIDPNRKNPYIGIHLHPDENTIPVLLAINSLSCCYLPIDPKLPFERMKYVINDAKPAIIITNSHDEKIKEITAENKDILLVDLKDILSTETDLEINSIKLDNKDACLLYTSGSTGVPKGVLLPNSSIMNRLHWQWEEFNLDETDIGAFKTSLNFVDHISEIFAFILKGLPITVIDPEITSSSIDALINLLYENRATYFVLVPSLLRNILIFTKATKNFFKLNYIKRWVCSGEKLSRDLLDLFFEVTSELTIKPVISNFYGSTEVTADITFITFSSKEQVINQTLSQSDVPIGIPISNSKVFLFDENMSLIDCDDKIGEIYAGGLCLARGYLKNANETNRFIQIDNETLFKTGDFGYFHNSLLYYSGRADSQIKVNGKRVDLSELEYNSTKINEIKTFVPLVYDDFIIAFYESNLDLLTEQINEQIIEHFKSCVYEHMIPNIHNLIRVESIPLLYNGKIDKQKLKNLYKESYQSRKNNDNLVSYDSKSLTDKILNCIQKITGIYLDNSHLDLSFDKLGINSLNYVEIFFQLNEIFENKLDFNQFITLKSVNELLDQTREKTTPKSSYRLLKFSQDASYSFLVLNMFVETFTKKNALHLSYINDANEKNTKDCFYPMVEYLKNSDLCFIVYDTLKEKYVGGCFIYDYFNDDPPCNIVNDFFFHLLELLTSKSKVVSDRDWFKNKKVLHGSIVTTSPETTPEENVMIVSFIEEQIVNVAKEFNFDAILTSNTSKLTEDVTVKMNQYVIEFEEPINKYEHNGNRFFSKVDDSEMISICVKYLK